MTHERNHFEHSVTNNNILVKNCNSIFHNFKNLINFIIPHCRFRDPNHYSQCYQTNTVTIRPMAHVTHKRSYNIDGELLTRL